MCSRCNAFQQPLKRDFLSFWYVQNFICLCCFQGPDGEDTSVESATKRIALAAKLIQVSSGDHVSFRILWMNIFICVSIADKTPNLKPWSKQQNVFFFSVVHGRKTSRTWFGKKNICPWKRSVSKRSSLSGVHFEDDIEARARDTWWWLVDEFCQRAHVFKIIQREGKREVVSSTTSALNISLGICIAVLLHFHTSVYCRYSFMSFTHYCPPESVVPKSHSEVIRFTQGHTALGTDYFAQKKIIKRSLVFVFDDGDTLSKNGNFCLQQVEEDLPCLEQGIYTHGRHALKSLCQGSLTQEKSIVRNWWTTVPTGMSPYFERYIYWTHT